MNQVYKSFKGTAREFIAAGVTINGKEINQPGLSLMAQYGVAKIVGEVPRPEGKKGILRKSMQSMVKRGCGWNTAKK